MTETAVEQTFKLRYMRRPVAEQDQAEPDRVQPEMEKQEEMSEPQPAVILPVLIIQDLEEQPEQLILRPQPGQETRLRQILGLEVRAAAAAAQMFLAAAPAEMQLRAAQGVCTAAAAAAAVHIPQPAIWAKHPAEAEMEQPELQSLLLIFKCR